MIAVPLALAGAAGLLAYATYEPNCPVFGPVTGHGPEQPVIFLTFDDGPSRGVTPAILDTLAKLGAPAAFFMVGRYAREQRELARAVADGGHIIGNHTETHVKLHRRLPSQIRHELHAAHDSLADATGVAPRAFRAPHGYRNPFVRPVTDALGYQVFGWTFGVWDSARPGAEEIRRRVRAKLRPGAIVLLHDGDGYDPGGDRSQTAAALPGIVADARDAGYEIRPLSDLMTR